MKVFILILFLMASYCQAQKPLQNLPAAPVKTITYEREMVKARRYFTFGVISMATGGILILFSSKLGQLNANPKHIRLGGAGLSFIGLGAMVQSSFHSKRARKIKDY